MSDQSNDQDREERQRPRTFTPNDHLIQLKNKDGSRDYLPVRWRLVWFRNACPEGTIETEMVHLDLEKETEEEVQVWNAEKRRNEKVMRTARGLAIFRATVKDGRGGVAVGTKMEKAASFPDFLEKSETGAIGRALAALGYGTQFAPEMDEAHRIVDSPVERQFSSGSSFSNVVDVRPAMTTVNANGDNTRPAMATEQQIASIRKLCEYLGKVGPEQVASMSYLSAKQLIQQLTTEYRESKQSKKAS